MFYITIQIILVIMRKVRPRPSRQGKGDGQEAEVKEAGVSLKEKEVGEEDSSPESALLLDSQESQVILHILSTSQSYCSEKYITASF